MPKISVIVPVYKVEKYIEKCVCSLMEQTLDNIEYIFVDDCSPDNSIKILETTLGRYPHRVENVRIIHHDVNKGLSSARNSGLAVARGEYIAHCDSDDWVELTMYEKLYKKAKAENADVCFSNFYFAYNDKNEPYECTSVYANKIRTINSYIKTTWTVLWNIVAKRSLYSEYKLCAPENISYCEDFYLSVRLFYFARKIVKVDEALYYYNQTNVNSIMSGFNLKFERDERWAYLNTIKLFKQEKVYDHYKQSMCWRVLKSTQDAAVHIDRYKDFLSVYPESHRYIWSCPYDLNFKSRVIMSLLAFYPLRFVGVAIIWFRKFLQR